MDLWSEASRDVEAENDGRRFLTAKVATSDWWSFLAAAETKSDLINRLALVQDRLDSVVAATLPEDVDPREVLTLSARVSGSLIEDWDTSQRARMVEAAMRKGAPFADYSDFKDCTSKNSDKDDPEAYCGKIQHQTEDSKTSKLASLFVLSERDQAAFDAEISRTATPFIPHAGPRHLMHQPPDPWGSEPVDSSIPGNSAVEHVKDPAPSTQGGADEASFWDKLKNHLVGPPHDPFALHASKTAGVPPEFLEQQKKKSDDDGSDSKDDSKDSDSNSDGGPGSSKWKEQQDGTNGDSKADPDDDGKAEDGSSNSAQKDDDSDGDDDKKSDGPPPWVKNKESAKVADLLDPGQAQRVVNWLAHGGPPPQGEDLDAIKKMFEQERGKQSSLQVEADNEAPYRLKESGGGWDVVNSEGEVKGHHDTRDEALAQQRALYANVPGAREKAEADEKKKSSSLDALLARSASLVTALGEQFTSDNPFGAGNDMASGGGMDVGSGGMPNTAQPGGMGGGGAMPMSSGPEARPWQDATSMPQTDMAATPNTPDATTQDTDSLQRPASKTASVDKVARITAGVLATNPGMDPAAARQIAEETVLRYPGSQKD